MLWGSCSPSIMWPHLRDDRARDSVGYPISALPAIAAWALARNKGHNSYAPFAAGFPALNRAPGPGAQRGDQVFRVVRVAVRLSVDEEARGALHPIADSACHVGFDPRQTLLISEIGAKPVFVEADCLCMGGQVVIRQRTLVSEKQVVHLPELSLDVRGLRGQGRVQRMRMDLGQRKVTKRVDESIAQLAANLRHADQRLARVGAFVVAVDQQSHGCAGCAANVVAAGDLGRQPGVAYHQLLSRARSVPPV